MKRLSLLLLVLAIITTGCSKKRGKSNPMAVKLNDSAVQLLVKAGYPQKYDHWALENTLPLLNKATDIDTDYYAAYFNKYNFQTYLKQYNYALKACKELIRLKPGDLNVILMTGEAYDRAGDTINAKRYYTIALSKINKVLDTAKIKSVGYDFAQMSKSDILVLMGRKNDAYVVNKKLFEEKTGSSFNYDAQKIFDLNREKILYDTSSLETITTTQKPNK